MIYKNQVTVMTDPYKVLNILSNASDEEVLTAYRKMVKKYHPDRYVGNPLADLADEKMKEVNAGQPRVYQVIINQDHPEEAAAGLNAYANYDNVRRLINQKKSRDAELILDQAIKKDRNAEWHFLKAFLLQQRGWLEDAYRHYCVAVKLNPRHPEYRKFYENIVCQRNIAYMQQQGQEQSAGSKFGNAIHGIFGSIFDICFR
jgi:molecular chaperone DnaJ